MSGSGTAKTRGNFESPSLDPAAGNHRTIGDYSAWVLLEADANGMFYVDAELAREPVDKCLSRGVRLALLYRPHAIGIEATAFQAVLAASDAARQPSPAFTCRPS